MMNLIIIAGIVVFFLIEKIVESFVGTSSDHSHSHSHSHGHNEKASSKNSTEQKKGKVAATK